MGNDGAREKETNNERRRGEGRGGEGSLVLWSYGVCSYLELYLIYENYQIYPYYQGNELT